MKLHGVDFSGGNERGGRNPKLWIATLDTESNTVTLEWGGARPGFNRRQLANEIAARGGLWLLDFPFGPQRDIARAMQWSSWTDYLLFCSQNVDPSELRARLRQAAKRASLTWSTKRRVDEARNTRFFPFFQWIFRQTIMGARDVLARLAAIHDNEPARVRVYPWHLPERTMHIGATIIEGFPGHAIRGLGLKPDLYKGNEHRHRQRRRAIADRMAELGLPLSRAIHKAAVNDPEGDALDALSLLTSAKRAYERPLRSWRAAHAELRNRECLIEGWFFD